MMTTGPSPKLDLAALAASLGMLAMLGPRSAEAGCTKDSECKDVRICEGGRCVYPPPEVGAQAPAKTDSPGAASSAATAADSIQPAAPPAAAPPAAPDIPPDPGAAGPAVAAPAAAAPVPPTPALVSRKVASPGSIRVAIRPSWFDRQGRTSRVEIGGFGFGTYDGNAGALGGGVYGGYRLSRWWAIGAWLEGNGQREQEMVRGRGAYRLYGLGIGPTVGKVVGPTFVDLSVLPKLTLLTVEGQDLNPGRSLSRWGVAADTRLRMGFVIGAWRPFIVLCGSYAVTGERLTLDDYPGQSAALPRGSVSLGFGVAYGFGATPLDATMEPYFPPGPGE